MQAEIQTQPIKIFNAEGEENLEPLIASACIKALGAIHEQWGLAAPPDCRVYVMTSWWKFFLDAAPWYINMLYLRLFPFWIARVERMWAVAGAWTQRFGSRVAIGVKPPRLLASSDTTIGKLIFEEEPDLHRKLQLLVCHELTHACAARLALPAWLNEAIAMLTVDRFAGRRTVRADTQTWLKTEAPRTRPPGYRQLAGLDGKSMALHTARGYWLVDRIENRLPGFFRRQFAAWQVRRALEREMAALLGLPVGQFWERVDDAIA